MKLIDADKLVARWESLFNKDGKPVAVMFTNAAINDVKREPTVEAIPVEWIEQYVYKHGMYVCAPALISEWRAERKEE